MKIHIDIPPESPAVQRLISETKMYKDKYSRSIRALRIRCAHFIFANIMGIIYVIALVSWHSQLCWFNYTTSITILWVSLVTWITRFFWGVCATVMLFIERRALNTLAPKSEELKSLLEDNTDKQEQEKIQKHSAQLKYEREFYAKFVRETCIFETWATLHLGYFLGFYLSIRASRDIIPFWVVNVLGNGILVIVPCYIVALGYWKCCLEKRLLNK